MAEQRHQGLVLAQHLEREPVFFEGVPVIPLDWVDELHERPRNSSRRTFNKKRRFFTPGEDFVKLPPEFYNRLQRTSVRASQSRTSRKGHSPQPVTAVTEQGYLLLIKPFGDDLSWRIQKRLAKTYWKAKELGTAAKAAVEDANARAEHAELVARQAENETRALRRAMLALLDREELRSKRESSHAGSALAARKGDLRAQRAARSELQPFWGSRDLPGQEQFGIDERGNLALPDDSTLGLDLPRRGRLDPMGDA